MTQYKQTLALRKWLILALIVLAFLMIVAISYFTLSAIWPIGHLHAIASVPPPDPNIMNGRP